MKVTLFGSHFDFWEIKKSLFRLIRVVGDR